MAKVNHLLKGHIGVPDQVLGVQNDHFRLAKNVVTEKNERHIIGVEFCCPNFKKIVKITNIYIKLITAMWHIGLDFKNVWGS